MTDDPPFLPLETRRSGSQPVGVEPVLPPVQDWRGSPLLPLRHLFARLEFSPQ